MGVTFENMDMENEYNMGEEYNYDDMDNWEDNAETYDMASESYEESGEEENYPFDMEGADYDEFEYEEEENAGEYYEDVYDTDEQGSQYYILDKESMDEPEYDSAGYIIGNNPLVNKEDYDAEYNEKREKKHYEEAHERAFSN